MEINSQRPPLPHPTSGSAGGQVPHSPAKAAEDQGLSPEEQHEVEQLQARDREVRAHEQAHLSAAGGNARGGPSFSYQRGPDGRQYAVGGEVNIDTSEVSGDPEATLQKAEQVRRAALAPSQPSGQDRAVAAAAAATAAKARQEIQETTQGRAQEGASPQPREATAGGFFDQHT